MSIPPPTPPRDRSTITALIDDVCTPDRSRASVMGPAFIAGVAVAIEKDLGWQLEKTVTEAMPEDSKVLWQKAATGEKSLRVVTEQEQTDFAKTIREFTDALPAVAAGIVMNGTAMTKLLEKFTEREQHMKEDYDEKLAKAKAHYHELLELTKNSTVKPDAVSVAKKVYDEEMQRLEKDYTDIQNAKEQAKMAEAMASKSANGIQYLESKHQAQWNDELHEFVVDNPMTDEETTRLTKLQHSWNFNDKLANSKQKEAERLEKRLGLKDGETSDQSNKNKSKLGLGADMAEHSLTTFRGKMESWMGNRKHALNALIPAITFINSAYEKNTNTFEKAPTEVPKSVKEAYDCQNKEAYMEFAAEVGLSKMEDLLQIHMGGHDNTVEIRAERNDFCSVWHYIISRYASGDIFKESERIKEIEVFFEQFKDGDCAALAEKLVVMVKDAKLLYNYQARHHDVIKIAAAFIHRYHMGGGAHLSEQMKPFQDGGKGKGIASYDCTDHLIACCEKITALCIFLKNNDPHYEKKSARMAKIQTAETHQEKRAQRLAETSPYKKKDAKGKDGGKGKGKNGKGKGKGKGGDDKGGRGQGGKPKCQVEVKGARCKQDAAPLANPSEHGKQHDRLCLSCKQDANKNRPCELKIHKDSPSYEKGGKNTITFREMQVKKAEKRDLESDEEEAEERNVAKAIKIASKKAKKAKFGVSQ